MADAPAPLRVVVHRERDGVQPVRRRQVSRRGGRREHEQHEEIHRRRGQDPPRAPDVERDEIDPLSPCVLVEQQLRDEVAGDHEEDRDAEVADVAGHRQRRRETEMSRSRHVRVRDQRDRDGPQAIERRDPCTGRLRNLKRIGHDDDKQVGSLLVAPAAPISFLPRLRPCRVSPADCDISSRRQKSPRLSYRDGLGSMDRGMAMRRWVVTRLLTPVPSRRGPSGRRRRATPRRSRTPSRCPKASSSDPTTSCRSSSGVTKT